MNTINKRTALVACALLFAGGVSFAAAQHRQRAVEGRQGHAARFERAPGQRHARLGELLQRRARGRELVHSLGITEAQKEQARGIARSLRPIGVDVRPQAMTLIRRARELARSGDRKSARALLRTELRPLFEDALARARPLVQPLVSMLSPDQRARLEAAAAERGKSFDEERFTRRLGWMLARRGVRR